MTIAEPLPLTTGLPAQEGLPWNLAALSMQTLDGLAYVAVSNVLTLHTEAQAGILRDILYLPVEALDLDAIIKCALGQDDRAQVENDFDDDVILAACAVCHREDVLVHINVAGVMEIFANADGEYRVLQAVVNLLAAFPTAQIAEQIGTICTYAQAQDDDDDMASAFYQACADLLKRHDRMDDLSTYATGSRRRRRHRVWYCLSRSVDGASGNATAIVAQRLTTSRLFLLTSTALMF